MCLNVQIKNKNALYVFNLSVTFQTHPYFADTGGSTPLEAAEDREIIRLLKKAQNEEVESMVKVSSEYIDDFFSSIITNRIFGDIFDNIVG